MIEEPMIDTNAFAQLEERIEKAIHRVRDLTRERDEARAKADELQKAMDQLEARNQELQGEVERVRSSTVDRDEYEARKREIERRVEDLLQRFGELDDVGND